MLSHYSSPSIPFLPPPSSIPYSPQQALQYLCKVCNHPALVVTPDHPLYSKVQEYLRKNTTDLKDIRHAAKLQALK